ncbi:MAG: hypothetical protein EZS28_024229 [Streblomastix strix]|uniref:PABC domain-containing protein n=1 Tax=Streblomastix strix TaxID=222440 RepID=A0A5J4VCZ0_9EUKA|nr:MAG: hypothetical protein EZS28_024229 [Streblomastix strix]
MMAIQNRRSAIGIYRKQGKDVDKAIEYILDQRKKSLEDEQQRKLEEEQEQVKKLEQKKEQEQKQQKEKEQIKEKEKVQQKEQYQKKEQEKEQEIENQQEQELTNDDKTDFDILSIDHGTDEEKKNNIGEYIYEYIEQDHKELAGKITGMIRELDLSELQQIVNLQFQIQAEGRSRIAQVEYMNSESALEAFNSSPDRRIFGGAILQIHFESSISKSNPFSFSQSVYSLSKDISIHSQHLYDITAIDQTPQVQYISNSSKPQLILSPPPRFTPYNPQPSLLKPLQPSLLTPPQPETQSQIPI